MFLSPHHRSNVWLIHETTDGRVAYETTRYTQALSASAFVKSYQVHDIEKMDVLHTTAGNTLVSYGEPVADDRLPDLVIARPDTLKVFPQWIPVLQHLEARDVLCVNSSASIRATADKFETYRCLRAHNIPTPDVVTVSDNSNATELAAELGLPLVMKQVFGTGGVGVALCHSAEEITRTAQAFRALHPDVDLIAQKFLATSKGRDVRAVVRDGKVVASILRQSASADEFRSNHSLGGSVQAYDLSEEGQSIAVQTARALGLDHAGIDLLFGKNGFEVCEANAAHGFKGLEEAHKGMDVAGDHLRHFLHLANRHRDTINATQGSHGRAKGWQAALA